MCKTKPNIFHTTSLNRDLHHPNIPNMWRGPTDLRVRLELRSTFWNHEHTLTISYLASSIARFWRWKHSALDTLGGTRKKTERKVQRYQTYSQILQILTQSNMSSKEIIKFDWVDSRAYSFQRTNPSWPLSGSDLPSSLLQLSISPPWCSSHVEYNWRGLWISSTPKYLGSKLTTDFPLSSDLQREVVVWCLLNFHPMACYAILAPPWHTRHFLRTPRNRPARKTRKSWKEE